MGKFRRVFTIAFKEKVISDYHRLKSFRKVSQIYKLNRKSVRLWVRNSDKLESITYKKRRFNLSSNQKSKYHRIEKRLFKWITKKRSSGSCISGPTIKRKALSIASRLSFSDFKASRGWLLRFLSRFNLALRLIASTGRDLPKNSQSIVKKFIENCQLTNKDYEKCEIYGMDETSVYLDFPGSYTYAKKGSKSVKCVTSGNEKSRISIAFCCSADGNKLEPLIVVPRKKPLKNFTPPRGVIVEYKPAGTFDSKIICDGFLNRVLFPNLYRNKQKSAVLYWDNSTCHKTAEVKILCARENVHLSFIPPRMTSILQPADVFWLGKMKKEFHRIWNEWYISCPKSLTKNGNLKSPGYEKVIQWVARIWRSLNQDFIRKSFDECGITANISSNFNPALRELVENDVVVPNVVEETQGEEEVEGFDAEYETGENELQEDDEEIHDYEDFETEKGSDRQDSDEDELDEEEEDEFDEEEEDELDEEEHELEEEEDELDDEDDEELVDEELGEEEEDEQNEDELEKEDDDELVEDLLEKEKLYKVENKLENSSFKRKKTKTPLVLLRRSKRLCNIPG